jgi:hypothetical protein
VVHHQGEDTTESTKQLAEDLMAITTVFQAIITENEQRKADADESMQRKEDEEKSQEANRRRFIVFLGLVK